METKIIAAFQGCGKSYVTKNIPQLKCRDMDFKYYRDKKDWQDNYISLIQENIGKYDYVFCNISEEIMDRLNKADILFYVVAPVWCDDTEKNSREFQKLKALMFGRYVLRKEQTPDNLKWLNRIKRHYDDWTSEKFFSRYVPQERIIRLTCDKDTLYDVLKINFREII